MKRWILILLSVAVVAGFIVWRLYQKSQDARAQAQARTAAAKAPPPVTVAPVTSRDIVQTYVAVGSVTAPFNVKIAPKVSGRLDYLVKREGAPVTQGEVLARIDPSQIQAQVSQQKATIAESEYRLAEAQYNQNPTNVNVATQIQQQVAALASARADDNQTRQNYNSQVAAAKAAVTDAQGRIDSADATIANAQASIRSAQANVNNAQVRYNRTYDIYKQGFVAAQDVDDALTTLKVQQEAEDVSKGLLRSAQSAKDSAVAQKESAQHQYDITVTKGKADIAAADAKVTQAQAALKYARSNTAQTPAYQQNLAALRATVNANKAQLQNLESQLSDTILTSPISGFITARYVDPGAIVSPSQPVVAVQAIKDVFVDVSVPEEVSNHLHVGQDGSAVFDALPSRTFTGRITQITPAADPTSRQFPVRLTLDNRDNLIKPGMFARVTLVTQRVPGALVVPREAVQRSKTGPMVVVVDDKGVAHRRKVEVGAQDAAGIQIREGVQLNEIVVTLSNAQIKDGQKVKIANLGGPAGANPPTTGGGGAPLARGGGSSTANDLAGGPIVGPSGSDQGSTQGPASPRSGSSSVAGTERGNSGSAASQTTMGAASQSGVPVTTAPNATTSAASVPNTPPQVPAPTPSSVPSGQGASGSSTAPQTANPAPSRGGAAQAGAAGK